MTHFRLLILLVALAAAAHADDSNFRPYIVGSRAAGMGGAFTAIADDGSGPFYNPGGIAFAARTQLSLSGSVYGIATGSFKDALGDGHDFSYHSLNISPTTTSAVFRLGPEGSKDGYVVALSVFVPDASLTDGRDQLFSQSNAFFITQQIQTVWGGLTLARRMGNLGIGASAFLLFGTRLSELDLTAVNGSNVFATITQRSDETTIGIVGAIGARWDVTREVSLGASLYTPSVGWGSRRVFIRATEALQGQTPQAVVVNVDGLHASPADPMRIQLGGAYHSGPLTLSADLILLLARDIDDDADQAGQGLDRHITRNTVLDAALGMEYVLGSSFPFRAGFYTDFAASPDTDVNGDTQNTNHVNRYGGTVSIGMRSEHSSTDVGVNVSGGSGTDVVPNNLDFTQLKVTDASQLSLYLFLGTSYQF
jgi:long-chain fatty acid transport protein